MDAKALAKSKRAHSQQHKNKSYPHQKSKAPSVSSGNAGSTAKTPGKLVGEKARQAQRISRLPSNRDRYEDEFDSDIEDQSSDNTSQYSDVVVPKSKGADYSFLIAEAQSQSQLQSYFHSDGFPSFDDVMPGGFTEGIGSMLSVRGQGILSWTGDDNFIVEDRTMAVQEASFLSLNLNALAEQLAKVDLSQRLFVEADLFSSELGEEHSIASSIQESKKTQTRHESGAAADISRDVAVNACSKKVEIVDTEITSLGSHTCYNDATFSSRKPDLVNQVKDDYSSIQSGISGQSEAPDCTSEFKENSASVSKRKIPNFEAAAAEAELDMLLDSFSDTKFLDSSGYKSINTFPRSQQTRSTALPQVSGEVPDLSRDAAVAASFDDVLDDLLEETSNLMNQNHLSQSRDVKVVSHVTQSSAHSVSKSRVLDDFDSWLDTI